jgi:hypothetical protein
MAGVSIGEPYEFDKSAMVDDPELSKDMVRLLPFIMDVFARYLEPGNIKKRMLCDKQT